MRIVFIGPPGVGKGTQAQKLVNYLQVPHIASGDMLRKAKLGGDALDPQVSKQMDSGCLVPDPIIVHMMGERLARADCAAGFLLDGFPRTLPQAEALDRLLANGGPALDLVVVLGVQEEELFRRLLARAGTEARPDDTADTIRRRMRVYREQTEPLLEYYRDRGILRNVEGAGTPEEVFARIQAICDAVKE